MSVRFQADADLNQIIVKATLRLSANIDFQTAQDAGLDGLTDVDVLKIAAEQNRILVTHDMRTMPTHFADFIRSEQSPGVLIVSQKMAPAKAAQDLVLIWAASTPEEWSNQLRTLPL